jgi:tRNA-splicing ligase RtcB
MEPSLQDTGDFFRETFSGSRVPAYEWTHGVEFEDSARAQIANLTRMPFMYRHVAVMPDAHWGNGATVGSVLATKGAIIPAAVGVDLGCFVGETTVYVIVAVLTGPSVV